VDLNTALDLIEDIDGSGFDLVGREAAYADFPLDEYRQRYARLAALMEHEGIDALLLTLEESVRWVSGYNSVIWVAQRWLPSVLVVPRDPAGAVLVNSAFDAGCAAGTAWVEVDGYLKLEELAGKVAERLASLGAQTVAIEREVGSLMALPWNVARDVAAAAGGDPSDASRLMSAARMLKSPRELERIRAAVRATVAGYSDALGTVAAGVTEKQITSRLASVAYANGATPGTRPPFLNAVAGPDRYALVDSPASDRPLGPGDVLFLDGGTGSDGYMADLIRLAAVEPSAESERYADAAKAATAAMVDAARPGISASALYAAGLESFRDSGVGEFAGSLFGHGIGLEIWERPLLAPHDDPAEDVTVRAEMVLCLEPILAPVADGAVAGIYVFEDMVAVTADGNELLSAELPRELVRG
jgi:Xaa-Pro aminopeptidase